IVRTWIDWGLLREANKRGTYSPVTPIKVGGQLATWLIEALLVGANVESLSVAKLTSNPSLFPFQLDITPSDLRRAPHLSVHKQGVDQDVVSRRGLPR